MECFKKLKTVEAAERARSRGCPKCGGTDVDLVTEEPPDDWKMVPSMNPRES